MMKRALMVAKSQQPDPFFVQAESEDEEEFKDRLSREAIMAMEAEAIRKHAQEFGVTPRL